MNNNENKLEKMLTPKDIKEHLGISRNSVYKLFKTYGFPKFRIGNQYFVPESQYNEWIQKSVKNDVKIFL